MSAIALLSAMPILNILTFVGIIGLINKHTPANAWVLVVSVADAGSNILSGKGTWKDAVTLGVAGLTGAAMATGVGEVAMAIVGVGWDLFNMLSK